MTLANVRQAVLRLFDRLLPSTNTWGRATAPPNVSKPVFENVGEIVFSVPGNYVNWCVECNTPAQQEDCGSLGHEMTYLAGWKSIWLAQIETREARDYRMKMLAAMEAAYHGEPLVIRRKFDGKL